MILWDEKTLYNYRILYINLFLFYKFKVIKLYIQLGGLLNFMNFNLKLNID